MHEDGFFLPSMPCGIALISFLGGRLAQLVEQETFNLTVRGSSPRGLTEQSRAAGLPLLVATHSVKTAARMGVIDDGQLPEVSEPAGSGTGAAGRRPGGRSERPKVPGLPRRGSSCSRTENGPDATPVQHEATSCPVSSYQWA